VLVTSKRRFIVGCTLPMCVAQSSIRRLLIELELDLGVATKFSRFVLRICECCVVVEHCVYIHVAAENEQFWENIPGNIFCAANGHDCD